RTDIALDGALSEIELLCHLGIRPPRAEESQDLAFPGRERPDGLLRRSIGLRPRPEPVDDSMGHSGRQVGRTGSRRMDCVLQLTRVRCLEQETACALF